MKVLRIKPSECIDFNEHDSDSDDGEMEGDFWGRHPARRLESALELMLRIGHESLECIELYDPYPLGRLFHPPLRSLNSLIVNSGRWWKAGQDSVWRVIAGINFQRAMPHLKEIQIYLEAARYRYRLVGNDDHQNVWPAVSGNLVPHCCDTVFKLELTVDCQQINISALQTMFPNVLHLSFAIYVRGRKKSNFELLKKIWESWPHLLDIEISTDHQVPSSGAKSLMLRYDANFLGIHEEEAEVLGQQDDDYLRSVHIVPLRPSLLTIPGECHELLIKINSIRQSPGLM